MVGLRANAMNPVLQEEEEELLALVLNMEAAVRRAMGIYISVYKEDPPLNTFDYAAATLTIIKLRNSYRQRMGRAIRTHADQINETNQDAQPDVKESDPLLDGKEVMGGFALPPAKGDGATHLRFTHLSLKINMISEIGAAWTFDSDSSDDIVDGPQRPQREGGVRERFRGFGDGLHADPKRLKKWAKSKMGKKPIETTRDLHSSAQPHGGPGSPQITTTAQSCMMG
ncbi:hypothetical protein FRB97_004348 [Tulasnella sp. 331]|nr:hypothetical protein FRB97_004348 [Tulasnella sp. 331]